MKHTIQGKSLRQYCIENGLNYMSVCDRINRKYEKPEESVKNIKPRKKYNGKSVRQICKEKGVSYSYCTKLMLFKGMSLDEALGRLLK